MFTLKMLGTTVFFAICSLVYAMSITQALIFGSFPFVILPVVILVVLWFGTYRILMHYV